MNLFNNMYIYIVVLVLAILCCSADGKDQQIYRKALPDVIVMGEGCKIDLGELYDGERYEITAKPQPKGIDYLSVSGVYCKIYKYSKELDKLDQVKEESHYLTFTGPFRINDVSADSFQPGHYYLLLTTIKEDKLCFGIGAIKGIGSLIEFCPADVPHASLEWEVQSAKLINKETAKEWNKKAERLFEQREFEKAASDLEYALEIDPQYAEAWNNRGNILTALGTDNLDDAIISYKRATEIDPDFAEAWYNYGNSLSQQGRYKEAISACDKAMALNPQYKDVYKKNISEIFYRYGSSLVDQGKIIESVEIFNRSIEIDYEIGIKNKKLIGETLYEKGNILFNRGEYFEATVVMDNAIRIDPEIKDLHNTTISQVWYKLSEVLFNEGRYTLACDAATKAVELDPQLLELHKKDISNYYLKWGEDLLEKGHYEDSEIVYNYAFELNPDKEIRNKTAESWSDKALILHQDGHCYNATIVYDMAIAIEPELNSKIEGDIVSAWFDWGKQLEKNERWLEAKSAFERVLAAKPEDVSVQNEINICDAHIALGTP